MESTAIKVQPGFAAYGADGRSQKYGFGKIDPVAAFAKARTTSIAAIIQPDSANSPLVFRSGRQSVKLVPEHDTRDSCISQRWTDRQKGYRESGSPIRQRAEARQRIVYRVPGFRSNSSVVG